MSFTAVFKSVLKRTNSTQVPNMQQDSTTLSVVVLDATSVMTPRIRLSYAGNPTNWNYCMISEFGRYYFITDWTSDHNQWIATLNCDVLATYKQTILASQEYVLRSASSWDGSIMDEAYPAKVDRTFHRLPPKTDYNGTPDYYPWKQGKSFIVGITGCVTEEAGTEPQLGVYSTSMIGSVSYYWLSPGELYSLVAYLLSEDALSDMWQITDITDNLQKGIINPLQYINSVIMVPFDRVLDQNYDRDNGTATMNIYYGYFKIAVTDLPQMYGHPAWVELYKPYNLRAINCAFDMRGIHHPEYSTRGKYMDFSPFTEYQITFEPFGTFSIDPKNLEDALGLKLVVELEGVEGMGTLKIYPFVNIGTEADPIIVVDQHRLIKYDQARIGIPISVAQITQDYVNRIGGDITGAAGMIANGVGLGASIVSGNIPGAVASGANLISGAASMIGNAINSMKPDLTVKGTNGNLYTILADGPFMYISWTLPVGEDLSQLGRPLCQKVTLSTLSGYCLCRDADIKITGTTSESDQIKDFLNSGFFIE